MIKIHYRKKNSHFSFFKKRIYAFFFCFMLISFYFLFVAFYSFGELDKSDLKTIEIDVEDIKAHSNRRKAWIIIVSSTGQQFYCRTDNMNVGNVESFADMLQQEVTNNKLCISYTNRIDMLPFNMFDFFNKKRIVILEVDKQTMIELNDYNRFNVGIRIGFVIISIIGVFIAIVFISIINKLDQPWDGSKPWKK